MKRISILKRNDGSEVILAYHLTSQQCLERLGEWKKKYPNARRLECKDGWKNWNRCPR